MCRGFRAWAAALAWAAAALGLQGCHNCLDNPKLRVAFEFAKKKYDIGKFDEAMSLYSKTLEMCPDFTEGMLGLANACREYGNQLFAATNELEIQKKPDQAMKMFQQAKEYHSYSMTLLGKLMESDPKDERPHYALGLLFYQRATSPVPYPYSMNDKGRQKERDLAIREFDICLQKVPSSYQAHRYLSLSLFAAGRMREAREHLVTYHGFVQRTYDRIFETWPGSADEDKKRKEAALQSLEREVTEVREVLAVYRGELERRKAEIEARREKLGPDEQLELARISRELLEMDDILRTFSAAGGSPAEKALRERCLEYLRCFNRSSLPECLSFVGGIGKEQESALRLKIKGMVEQGTRFEKIQFRSVTAAGDVGTVRVACDLTSRGETRQGAEMEFRWIMVAGLWRVAGHP